MHGIISDLLSQSIFFNIFKEFVHVDDVRIVKLKNITNECYEPPCTMKLLTKLTVSRGGRATFRFVAIIGPSW